MREDRIMYFTQSSLEEGRDRNEIDKIKLTRHMLQIAREQINWLECRLQEITF